MTLSMDVGQVSLHAVRWRAAVSARGRDLATPLHSQPYYADPPAHFVSNI
jgi:hypothetical protein